MSKPKRFVCRLLETYSPQGGPMESKSSADPSQVDVPGKPKSVVDKYPELLKQKSLTITSTIQPEPPESK